ncbi:MAG TPA: PilW family protein [Steroidobacteraceae bacterium]|nr:PilW family protein [Steroidobacteraceae bacterium]
MTRTRGFSIVELMVAITLALIVTTAVVSVFIGSQSAFRSTSGTAALSDSGRFALRFIENAVRDAGFMSCGSSTRTISNLNPQPTSLYYAPGPTGFFPPMAGFEAKNTGVGNAYTASTTAGVLANWNPTLDAAFSSLGGPSPGLPFKNNDILVVRSASQASQPAYVTSLAGNTFVVDAQQSLKAPQLAIISNCGQALLFQITGIAGAAPNVTVTHAAGGGAGGNAAATLPLSFGAGAMVAPLAATVYFIGTGADGDGALFAADMQTNNTFAPNELVPDIEAMQILYGLDATGAQNASQFVTADLVPDFGSVMSVQVAILAAGPPGSAATPPAAIRYNLLGTLVTAPRDNRARQVFEVTIAARNLLP